MVFYNKNSSKAKRGARHTSGDDGRTALWLRVTTRGTEFREVFVRDGGSGAV